MEDLNKYFASLDLKGEFSIGLLDNRHILIKLNNEQDFLRIYSRQVWHLGAISMRIFKWTSDFHVDRESSFAPVWVSFPRLPIHFFEKGTLFQIASLLGNPLHLDAATISLKRPSVARLQVEIDILKSRPNQIWIGIGDSDGFWQKVEYANVPPYCTHCWHLGHAESNCTIFNPGLKPNQNPEAPTLDPQSKQIYIPLRNNNPSVVDQVSGPSLTFAGDPGVIPDTNLISIPPNPIPTSVMTADPQVKLPASQNPLELSTALEDQHSKPVMVINPDTTSDEDELPISPDSQQQLQFISERPSLLPSLTRDDCHFLSIYGASNRGFLSASRVPIVPLESRESLLNNFREFQLKLRTTIPSKQLVAPASLPNFSNDTPSISHALVPFQSPASGQAPPNESSSAQSIIPDSELFDIPIEPQQPFQQVSRRRGRPRKQNPVPLVQNSAQNTLPLVSND